MNTLMITSPIFPKQNGAKLKNMVIKLIKKPEITSNSKNDQIFRLDINFSFI